MSINQMQQVFGSVCSGIEAASCAWHQLGWRAAWLAEIEPFPAAVLAHHFPDVPNLGDMTKLPKLVLTGKAAAPDVLVGGTPCQAFSVAGMREGLNDPRGQLTIKFVELADAIDHVRVARGDDPAVIVWENVPGVLSDRGNAFGCFLGALSGEDCELQPAGGKWSNAGCVFGPKRAVAWRVLDAQYFGVAQRRRRVFVVASARAGFNPAQVLFEFDGLRRDTPPRRGARPAVAALTANGVGTCGADDNQGQAGHLIPEICGTLDTECGGSKLTTQSVANGHILPVAGCWWDGGQVSQTLDAVLAKGQTMPEKNRFPAVLTPIAFHPTQDPISSTDGSTHAMGCGSSGGQASVGVAYGIRTANTSSNGWGIQEEATHTLDRGMGVAVAVSLRGREGGATAELGDEVQNCLRASGGGGDKAHVLAPVCVTGDITHTLKAEGFDGSEDGTGRGQPIVAFQPGNLSRGAGSAPSTEVFPTLKADHGCGASDQDPHVMQHMAVRRLTPRECERLQGFPDDWTLVEWYECCGARFHVSLGKHGCPNCEGDKEARLKSAADGPRYKAIGNSMAVPVMAFIGRRIQMAMEWRAVA